MSNYLLHLKTVGDSAVSYQRKLQYIDYNYSRYINKYKNPTVLEMGPGLGALIGYLNARGVEDIDIVDNDQSVISYIKKNFRIHSAVRTENLSTTKKKLRKYDLIFLMQIFEHIPKKQYLRVMQTLFASLKKGGAIIILVPNGNNPLNFSERYNDLQHEAAFTENSLKELPSYCCLARYETIVEPYRIPPSSFINCVRILFQTILHWLIICLIIVNGGVYQTIMTPNLTLIIEKK